MKELLFKMLCKYGSMTVFCFLALIFAGILSIIVAVTF